jgi:hypothetical protein
MPEKFEGVMITPKGIKDRDMDMDTAATKKKEPEGQEQKQEEQENPFLEYNNRTYQSYVKNGFVD